MQVKDFFITTGKVPALTFTVLSDVDGLYSEVAKMASIIECLGAKASTVSNTEKTATMAVTGGNVKYLLSFARVLPGILKWLRAERCLKVPFATADRSILCQVMLRRFGWEKKNMTNRAKWSAGLTRKSLKLISDNPVVAAFIVAKPKAITKSIAVEGESSFVVLDTLIRAGGNWQLQLSRLGEVSRYLERAITSVAAVHTQVLLDGKLVDVSEPEEKTVESGLDTTAESSVVVGGPEVDDKQTSKSKSDPKLSDKTKSKKRATSRKQASVSKNEKSTGSQPSAETLSGGEDEKVGPHSSATASSASV